jgi:hypothetical protein
MGYGVARNDSSIFTQLVCGLGSYANVRYFNQQSWKVKDCQCIEELMRIATNNIDELSSNTIAAVWSSIPRLISNCTTNHDHNHNRGGKKNMTTDTQQSKHQITTILRHTTNLQSRMGSKDLTTIILGMAKIVKNVGDAKQGRRMNVYQQSFGNVFLMTTRMCKLAFSSHWRREQMIF